jgi:hypothetical protein
VILSRRFRRPEKRIDPKAECFRRFFHDKLGRPGRSRTIYRNGLSPMIDVETYRAPWDASVCVIVSVGLSFYTGEHGERAELMLMVDEVPRAAEDAFRRIVGLIAEEPRAFGLGEFYEGPRSFGPIAKRYGKVAMVMATPQIEGQSLFHVDCDDDSGHVFVLVPITAAERDLVTTHGWDALEKRLAGVDVSDLDRPSVM